MEVLAIVSYLIAAATLTIIVDVPRAVFRLIKARPKGN